MPRFEEVVKGSWPERVGQTKEWTLVSVSVCEERKGVFCVKVCKGRHVEEEFLSGPEVDAFVANIIPADTTALWSKYLTDCASNGCDPLNVLPKPDRRREAHIVKLRLRDSGIYLDGVYPSAVQHRLLCQQTPDGLRVGREWSAHFVKGSDSTTITLNVEIALTKEECRSWYRGLLHQASPRPSTRRSRKNNPILVAKNRPFLMAA